MALFNTGYKEYSQKSNYSNIQNMLELRSAQRSLNHKIMEKELALNYKYKEFKALFNPITYVNKIISKFAIIESVIQSFYNGYKSVVNIFSKREATETTSPGSAESAETTASNSNLETNSL